MEIVFWVIGGFMLFVSGVGVGVWITEARWESWCDANRIPFPPRTGQW